VEGGRGVWGRGRGNRIDILLLKFREHLGIIENSWPGKKKTGNGGEKTRGKKTNAFIKYALFEDPAVLVYCNFILCSYLGSGGVYLRQARSWKTKEDLGVGKKRELIMAKGMAKRC